MLQDLTREQGKQIEIKQDRASFFRMKQLFIIPIPPGKMCDLFAQILKFAIFVLAKTGKEPSKVAALFQTIFAGAIF